MVKKYRPPRRQTRDDDFVRDDYDSGRRGKVTWAGIAMSDGFKHQLDYVIRMPAQRLFYNACRRIQVQAARLTGTVTEGNFTPKAKPQLAPCYSTYPATLAVHAALGLTGFLEYQAWISQRILLVHLAEYLKDPAGADRVSCDARAYARVAEQVTRIVQTRLLLEELRRAPAMSVVDMYRLFAAAQQTARFETLAEIVEAVILYGDVVPDGLNGQPVHPMTRNILSDVRKACQKFFARLVDVKPPGMVALGKEWVPAICKCLAPYLPPPGPAGQPNIPPDLVPDPETLRRLLGRRGRYQFPPEQPKPQKAPDSDYIPPLDEPRPPALEPTSAAQRIAEALFGGPPNASETPEAAARRKMLEAFSQALMKAGQQSQWEDMRSDLVEQALRMGGFKEGPIQGSPTEGHEVHVKFGDEQTAVGQLVDRAVELSDNLPAYDKLLAEARSATDALRRTLYPNIQEIHRTERYRSSGALDGTRLSLAEFSKAVFKRARLEEGADRRGSPVLLIACDGSGSLNARQMRLLKVLAAAWLNSTIRTRVQVLAGLYHSGSHRQNVTGPLVQWIYHPRKTPAVSRREAARALISLPESGTGVQSDALSLAFLVEEAQRLARGRMIYLILLTDTQWNRSFNTQRDGKTEMTDFFRATNEELGDRLHTTLVALGLGTKETGFEQLVDKVIIVPNDQLTDYAGVAQRIGVYVASCMKDRHKWLATTG